MRRASIVSLRVLRHALAALGALYLLVTVTPLVSWWTLRLSDAWYGPQADVLIVLAADGAGPHTIGLDSYWRAVYAVWAWREGHIGRILVSGGGQPPSAIPIAEFLTAEGVPAGRIGVETQSTTTRENALFSRQMLAQESGRMLLLSSDYHMYRARRTFERAGLRVYSFPAPDLMKAGNGWRSRWPAFLMLCEESAKIAWYRWQGWI